MTTSLLTQDRSIFLLAIVYLVGVLGACLPLHPQFLSLTPINLLFSLGMVLWFHPQWKRETGYLLLTCYLVGFGVEVIGVQTGLIFGTYSYGSTLGWKLWETPLMIGVNWVLLVYCSCVSINQFMADRSPWLKTTLAAALMVILDVFIEPVAIRKDFWSWEQGDIPLQNYLAWYIIAFVLVRLFYHIEGSVNNKVGLALLLLQFLFFGALNLF